MFAPVVFIMASLEIGRKILLDAKGPFGNNVIKNQATLSVYVYSFVVSIPNE